MRILRKKMLKMKLKTDNPIPVKARLKELFGDWLFISGYLIFLFLLAMGFYNLILGGIPTFTEAQNQLLAFSTSVLPLTVIFAWLDYRKGSFGKRWVGLQLIYKHKSFAHSLLRSAIKFFPWQLGHMGAIHSAYQADSWSIFLSTSAGILLLSFLLMGLLRKDKRHPADLLAGTQVQLQD